jgi:LuxR family transcriptional regulator, regulator of acetate metabolism
VSEPAEAVEMRAALLRLRRATGIPIAFGGLLHDAQRLRIAATASAGSRWRSPGRAR